MACSPAFGEYSPPNTASSGCCVAQVMLHSILSPRLLMLVTFLASVTFVQFRGRVRHKPSRLVADHANLLAPYNSLMYLFSAVKAKPYADVRGSFRS